MGIILETKGNIFNSQAQTITVTINTVGAMGKGLARYARDHVPGLYEAYRAAIKRQEIQIDTLWGFTPAEGPQILCFPTKREWWYPSERVWIEDNLISLVQDYKALGIESLAVPPLGCNNGGLNYADDIRELMYTHLDQLPIPVEIWT